MCHSSNVYNACLKLDMCTTGDNSKFVLKDGLFYRRYHDELLFVMLMSTRKSIVVTVHDLSGHPTVDITVANILPISVTSVVRLGEVLGGLTIKLYNIYGLEHSPMQLSYRSVHTCRTGISCCRSPRFSSVHGL